MEMLDETKTGVVLSYFLWGSGEYDVCRLEQLHLGIFVEVKNPVTVDFGMYIQSILSMELHEQKRVECVGQLKWVGVWYDLVWGCFIQ